MPDQKVKTVGSKLEVWRGTAKHTAGGLKKADLMQNKKGKIVSQRKHKAGLQTGKQNLGAYLQSAGGARRSGRARKPVKGSGLLGDILGLGLPEGSAVPAYSSRGGRLPKRKTQKGKGLLSFLGLGLPPSSSAVPAYSSRGGALARRKQKGGGIFGSVGDVLDHVF